MHQVPPHGPDLGEPTDELRGDAACETALSGYFSGQSTQAVSSAHFARCGSRRSLGNSIATPPMAGERNTATSTRPPTCRFNQDGVQILASSRVTWPAGAHVY